MESKPQSKLLLRRTKFEFQSILRVLREHLVRVWKLKRYSSSRKIAEKRDSSNRGFGTARFEVESSDQAKIKSRLSDLIEGRSSVGSDCGDREGN
jgi:hypothetical protein